MSDTASVLTREIMDKAIQTVRDASPRTPCGTIARPHAVHPREYERGGWFVCADCRRPVFVKAAP